MVKIFVKKRGIIIGVLIAILLLFYQISSMREQVRQELLLSTSGIAVNLGIIIGGAISGFTIENYFIRKLAKKGSVLGCIIASILISPLSFYLGIISTPFGVALGSIFSTGTIISKTASYVGICVFIVLMIIIVEMIGAMIGAALGSLGESVMRSFKH